MLCRALKPDHIYADVIVIVNDIVPDDESVDVAIEDNRLAVAALTVVYFAALYGEPLNGSEVVARVYAYAVRASHAVYVAVFDLNIGQRLPGLASALVVDAVRAALDLQAFDSDVADVK